MGTGSRRRARKRPAAAPLREARRALCESEALLRLEHGVTRCLAKAGSVSAALKSVLRIVCEAKGWDCGRYFAADETAGELRCTECWGRDRPALRAFMKGSRGLRIARGAGLAGRVWQSGKPLWVADVRKDSRGPSALLAETAGIHGAADFPVESAAGILGVIAFSSRDVRKPEQRLLRVMEVVGRQLGQHLSHKRVEEEQRRFPLAKAFMVNTTLYALGPMASGFVELLEQCNTVAELQSHLEEYLKGITTGSGHESAEKYAAELSKLFPPKVG